jgi:hypothetical protein
MNFNNECLPFKGEIKIHGRPLGSLLATPLRMQKKSYQMLSGVGETEKMLIRRPNLNSNQTNDPTSIIRRRMNQEGAPAAKLLV